MENTITKKSKSLKCGSVIKPLSIIALVCTVLSCLTYFFYDDYERINGERVYELAVRPLYYWSLGNVLSFILTLAPVVLLMLYIFRFHSKLKATVLIPIIFSIFGLNTIFNFLFGYDYYGDFLPLGIYRILDLAILICSVLAVISTLKRFNKKVFIIVSMSVCLLYETLSLLEMFAVMEIYIEYLKYLYIFADTLGSVGRILLYTSLLLFGLKNRIPTILSISPEKEKKKIEKMSPEQALKRLNKDLELGIFTEEEHQLLRADIISKL